MTTIAENEVLTALMGTAPCDDCGHRAACRSEKLACLDFQAWVNYGRVLQPELRAPTRKIYSMIFRGERAA